MHKEKPPILVRRAIPLPKAIKGETLISLIEKANGEKLEIKTRLAEIDRTGKLLSASVKIILKPDYYSLPEYLSTQQAALIIAYYLLKHPLQVELEEEDFYVGGYFRIELNKCYSKLPFIQNMPHRRIYREQFLPLFERFHQTLCQDIYNL